LERYSPDNLFPRLPANIIETLCNYDWPGNIRELQNQLRQYLSIQRLDISSARQTEPARLPDASEEIAFEALQKEEGLHAAVETLEKRMIAALLEQTHWHRGKTAERLGVPRKTLQRKMKKYGF
jgi:DNA-binding NtrC family response regulator